MKRILSIDGGGVRGLIPATIIKRIEEETGKPVHETFDLIAGTSVGGILALALASGRSGSEVQQLIYEKAPQIFETSIWRRMGTVFTHTYPGVNLKKVAEEEFSEKYLATDLLTNVLIPAYELETKTPRFFSRTRARKRGTSNFRLADVACATASAPTYFPPAKATCEAGDTFSYIDGGVFANNPAMSAYVEARHIWPDEDDFMVVSLGTGQEHIRIPDTDKWGVLSWITKGTLLSIVFDGVSDTTAYHVYNMIPLHHYYRLTKNVDIELDEVDEATRNELIAIGNEIANEKEFKKVIEAVK